MPDTIRLGLIGDNIAKSQSPRLHRLAGAQNGRRVTYDSLVPAEIGLEFDALFAHVAGAGYRGVYDFADPDSSVFIISTGQSGHPLSRHYDNLGERWRQGEYIPMSLDPDLARAAAVGDTVLTPAEVAE